MATSIYLGMPPENIKQFIIDNYGPKDMTKVPLHFEAEEPNATMSFSIANGTYETSPTGEEGSWTLYNSGDTITLANVGDKVYFRAGSEEGNETCSGSQFYIGKDNFKGKIAAKGNIQSLLDRKMEIMNATDGCYDGMFYGCTALTQAPVLPAETLAFNCYRSMFAGCTSLTQAPELPAKTLNSYCYEGMFVGCTSLTQAPALPATTLAEDCYYNMFKKCTSLTNAYFPNLDSNTVIANIVEKQYAFSDAADDIETQCSDKTIIINSTSV